MIENLAEHGVQAMDLVPSLMTTHTVANPEYDPEEARRRNEQSATDEPDTSDPDDTDDISVQTLVEQGPSPKQASPSRNAETSAPVTPTTPAPFTATNTVSNPTQTTARVLGDTTTHMAGVTTSLSSADENVTLDIRWTILCDLFLILIADSVYDARSRVLLENVAQKLGLGWLDVVRFESRVTEALEIQEDIENLEQREIMDGVQKAGRRRRYMILGLATLGMCAAPTSRSMCSILAFLRRRSCSRSVRWSISTCYWCRFSRCFLGCRYYRNWCILGWHSWRCRDHHRRCSYRVCNRRSRNGKAYKKCSYIRSSSSAQQ
jgi:hypothetical protein